VARFVPYAETMDCAAKGSTWPAVDNATVKAGAGACTTVALYPQMPDCRLRLPPQSAR
jgi:hypothetical protein